MCREVRRQTCDLVSLLEMAQPLSHYYMFMEDDFRLAPGPAQKAQKGNPCAVAGSPDSAGALAHAWLHI